MCNSPDHHHGLYAPKPGTRKLEKLLDKVEGKMKMEIFVNPDNTLGHVRVSSTEPPRFFEAICKGRDPLEIATIVQRICGVCPYPYGLAASKAAEEAFGYTLTPQAKDLRRLALAANTFSSHVLHAVLLVLPRLLRVSSVLDVEQMEPEIAKKMLVLYKLSNDLADVTGGRGVHATGIIPGGMSLIPKQDVLEDLLKRLTEAHESYDLLVNVFAGAQQPFMLGLPEREREFIALLGTTSYPLYSDGELVASTKAGAMTNEQFRNYKIEEVSDETNSKLVRTQMSDSFMVGALARLNINTQFMTERAKKDCAVFGLTFPCHDPYMNTAAQIVEGRIILEDTIALITKLITQGLVKESPSVVAQAGSGFGILEAPRGLMYQRYEYGDNGLATHADCIIPTGMTYASMQADLEHYVPKYLERGMSDDEIVRMCDLLLAHYDPCNSCAVHLVRFKY